MNSKEVETVAELLLGNWNERLPSSGPVKISVLRPWTRMLSDLGFDEAVAAVDALALSDTYMPRPAALRKKILQMNSQLAPPPSPALAWAEVQTLSKAVSSGTYDPGICHECVLEAVQAMGGISSLAVSTNGDRTFFVQAYTEIVNKWETRHYAPKI